MKHGSLAEERPDLVRQWSTSNELSPNEVSCGSHKKVLWNCENGHTWSATVKNRALSGSNCPYCEHRTILSGFNDLATLRPDLGRSWSKKNHIKPNEVSISSCTRVYWNCEKGHEWKARIADRTSGRGCPYCAGHLVWKGFNDLATTNPELIAEWSKKNTSISPDNVTAKNSTNVWWRCQKCGNTYQAVIKAKANGRHSCPYCAAIELENRKKAKQRQKKTAKFEHLLPKLTVIYFSRKYGFEVLTDSEYLTGMPVTAYIPELRLVFDVCKSQRDSLIKEHICGTKNTKYIRIPDAIPDKEVIILVRKAFAEYHIYPDSIPEYDLDIIRNLFDTWKNYTDKKYPL